MQVSKITSIQMSKINDKQEKKCNFTSKHLSKEIVTSKQVDNKKSRKKIYYGIGIASAILMTVVFRKQIKNLFNKLKPEATANRTPDKIEPSKNTLNIEALEKEKKEAERKELLKKFRELENEISETPKPVTAEEKKMYKAKFQLRQKYYREIKEKNISMVEDPNFSTDPTIDAEAKKQYLNRIKFLSVVNESSQKDCLDMYEKYGFRYWIDENCDRSFIRDLSLIATPSEFSDGEYLMNRFLDIAEKTTEHDPLGMRDGNKVMLMYEMHGCNYSEELTLRFINLMKKLSFQQLDATVFEIRTAGKRTPAISKAIEELKQITKDFPEVDRFKNT